MGAGNRIQVDGVVPGTSDIATSPATVGKNIAARLAKATDAERRAILDDVCQRLVGLVNNDGEEAAAILLAELVPDDESLVINDVLDHVRENGDAKDFFIAMMDELERRHRDLGELSKPALARTIDVANRPPFGPVRNRAVHRLSEATRRAEVLTGASLAGTTHSLETQALTALRNVGMPLHGSLNGYAIVKTVANVWSPIAGRLGRENPETRARLALRAAALLVDGVPERSDRTSANVQAVAFGLRVLLDGYAGVQKPSEAPVAKTAVSRAKPEPLALDAFDAALPNLPAALRAAHQVLLEIARQQQPALQADDKASFDRLCDNAGVAVAHIEEALRSRIGLLAVREFQNSLRQPDLAKLRILALPESALAAEVFHSKNGRLASAAANGVAYQRGGEQWQIRWLAGDYAQARTRQAEWLERLGGAPYDLSRVTVLLQAHLDAGTSLAEVAKLWVSYLNTFFRHPGGGISYPRLERTSLPSQTHVDDLLVDRAGIKLADCDGLAYINATVFGALRLGGHALQARYVISSDHEAVMVDSPDGQWLFFNNTDCVVGRGSDGLVAIAPDFMAGAPAAYTVTDDHSANYVLARGWHLYDGQRYVGEATDADAWALGAAAAAGEALHLPEESYGDFLRQWLTGGGRRGE